MKFSFPFKSYCCAKHSLGSAILLAPPLPPFKFLKLQKHGRHEIAVLVAFSVEKQGEPELGGRGKGSPDPQLLTHAVLTQRQRPSAVTASLRN